MLGLSCSLCDLVSRLGIEPGPLRWEFRVLATGPPGKSPPAKVFLSVRINYPYWSSFQVSAAFYPLCSCFCDNDPMGSALSEATGHFNPPFCRLSQHLTTIKTNVIMDTASTAKITVNSYIILSTICQALLGPLPPPYRMGTINIPA